MAVDQKKPATCMFCSGPATQAFYLCASNAKGDTEKIVYKRIYIEMPGCGECCGKVSMCEATMNAGIAMVLLGGVGAALLYQFRPDWAPAFAAPACAVVAVLGVVLAAVGGLIKSRMRTNSPELERTAAAVAKTFDATGKVNVHPVMYLPSGVKPIPLDEFQSAR